MARLISWLLNLAYLSALVVLSPLIVWQSLWTGKYRDGYAQKLFGLVPVCNGDETCVWLHAVSVGEVNLLATILRELRAGHPAWRFVISTTSRAGYELAIKKYAELSVFYCPLDFSWAVRNAMRRVRPRVLVLAELELWPNLIAGAKSAGARVAIINGRMSDRSFPGYRRIRPFVASVLRQIDVIAAQDTESCERFCALGARAVRVHVTGSLKYDGAQTDRNNSRTAALRELAGILHDDVVFLAGSTQEPEEAVALQIYRNLAPRHPRLRLILVPRHPERFDSVAKLLERSGMPWQRRTQLGNASKRDDPQAVASGQPILLVDTVGELGAWWGSAHIAFVGGSFGARGGQNMIEPAAYGAAVCFGPNTRNFRDIVAALNVAEAAVTVHDAGELEAFVQRCLDEPAYAAALGSCAQQLVRSQLGATSRAIGLINELVTGKSSRSMATRTAA